MTGRYKPEHSSRQPVVLYDKDSNPVELVFDNGKLVVVDQELGNTLSLIKDEHGIIKGYDGTNYVDVRVDSAGRLVLANELLVNAEGLTVDLGQIKQGPAGTEPWPVQLSGNKVILVTLTNAEAITDTAPRSYWLSTASGLSRDEIAQVRNIAIYITDTHNATTAEFEMRTHNEASGTPNHPQNAIYSKQNELTSGVLYHTYQAKSAGAGASPSIKVIPCLDDFTGSDIMIRLAFATAPTSGALTIRARLRF